ncbi:MAG: ABC transporter ATP-binding protein, partial [Pyrinomonadaceae bacterium]
PGSAIALDLKKAATEIRRLSEEFKLAVNPESIIEHLSVGQQQRVELLKALYRHARLLILDEPTAVLTPQEVEEFFSILRRMREQGKTVVIITHKLSEVLAISDEVTVMRDGRVVDGLQTKDTNAAELARLMVGRDVLLRVEKDEPKVGRTELSVRNLSLGIKDRTPRLSDVSFEVRAGEIVGIAGVEGNGQTELIEILAGLNSPTSGEVWFEEKPTVSWIYPGAKSVMTLLVIMWSLSVVSTLVALPAGRPITIFFLIVFLLRSVLIGASLLALEKRRRWFMLPIGVLVFLGFWRLPTIFAMPVIPTALLFFSVVHALLLIYVLVIAFRTYREFGRNQRNELNMLGPRRVKELGIAHIPEDRHRRGLLLEFNLAENSILGVHYRKPIVGYAGVFLDNEAVRKRADEIIEGFDVRPRNPDLPARALSGGNQQKLIIGREFKVDPRFLLVSQPTRGVDIGAIEFIHSKLVALRDSGCAILLVSAELEEVTSLSDRLLIIHDGRIVGEVDPKVATIEEIGLLMTRGH